MWCLETCLGLETVSIPDFEVLVLISVLKKKVLVSVLRKRVLVLVPVLRPKVLMSWSLDQDQDIKLRSCCNVHAPLPRQLSVGRLFFRKRLSRHNQFTGLGLILTARSVAYLYWNWVQLSEITVCMSSIDISASSALVERVFSHSGWTIKPHRGRMDGSLREALVYLKCNPLFPTVFMTHLQPINCFVPTAQANLQMCV